MDEPARKLEAVRTEAFAKDTAVTTFWYQPGEPYRPLGVVVEPDQGDLERLSELTDNPDEWRLVHWKSAWRRWERVSDLRVDAAE